ncbi:MAG: succinate dehydrogenase [Deltaproteobacteria bacterium]|nr:succinate dehydrogenase [Deltaproteobacteria bacterium]
MAELAATPAPLASTAGLEKDRSYLWRRLHSFTGVLPVGAFMLFHLFENMAAIGGEKAYNAGIAHLASLLPIPYFFLIEIGVIVLPIAYHGLYGVYLAIEGKPNVGAYAFRRNFLYLAQRVTGVIALLYLAYHVVSLRVQITMLEAGGKVSGFSGIEGHPGYVSFGDMVQHYSNPLVLGFYFVGTLACAFHLANGLNGFCWTWGIAVGERARKVVEWLSWVVFIVLSVPFLHILYSFRLAGGH